MPANGGVRFSDTSESRSPGPSARSRGLDYLRDLQTKISNVDLSAFRHRQRTSFGNTNKPLPLLPAPLPLPSRPLIHASYSAPRLHDSLTPSREPRPGRVFPTEPLRPYSLPPAYDTSPQKYFRPSAYLRIPDAAHLSRPLSDPCPVKPVIQGGRKVKASSSTDITYVPSSSEDDDHLPGAATNRSPARRQRATSEQPPPTKLPARQAAAANRARASTFKAAAALRCAGFTRSGAPCKRLVRSTAPFLLERDQNADGDDEAPRLVGRYCKNHAGMICEVGGFYWRGREGKEETGVWVDFDGELKLTQYSRLRDSNRRGYD